jgi:kumamolisin
MIFQGFGAAHAAQGVTAGVRLPGHVPTVVVSRSKLLGVMPTSPKMDIVFVLPLQNKAALEAYVHHISTPGDALYCHYLTPTQFIATYSPSVAQYAAVQSYAKSLGLAVTKTNRNRTIVHVSGTVAQIETAFSLTLLQYRYVDGTTFYAPSANPLVASSISGSIAGIVGLSTAGKHVPNFRMRSAPTFDTAIGRNGSAATADLGPNDIKIAYGLKGTSLSGAGQSLALYELDGYDQSDIAGYAETYGLNSVPLTNMLLDGADGLGDGTGGQVEVTLDIELALGLANGLSNIYVYEAPNTAQGSIDAYAAIANDYDLTGAAAVSTSWGLPELYNDVGSIESESNSFLQMAAQGQSIYGATGDDGAYDDGYTLTVQDPTGQPYICGVGGTTLSTSVTGAYVSESSWDDAFDSASTGGISQLWPIPTYQQPAVTVDSLASTSNRNVPDVSLDGNPDSGYQIYIALYGGLVPGVGGTSCAAPLWAAFTSLVDQERANSKKPPLGFPNTALYQLALSPTYNADFHDIQDGSTNQYYPAVTGYDCATGWGSFTGTTLLSALATASTTPATPSNFTATPGNAQVTLAWTAEIGTADYVISRSTLPTTGYVNIANVTASKYVDTTVKNGTTYYYTITAVSLTGASPASSPVAVTPFSGTFTITVAPKVKNIGTGEVTVTWTTSSPSNGTVDYGLTNTNAFSSSSPSITATHSINLLGLASGSTYEYYVVSDDGTAAVKSAVAKFLAP